MSLAGTLRNPGDIYTLHQKYQKDRIDSLLRLPGTAKGRDLFSLMLFCYIDVGSGFTFFTLGAWLSGLLLALLGIGVLFFKKVFKFIKRHKKVVLIILSVIIIIVFAIAGVSMSLMKSSFSKKIIILGFDGLSPNIVEPMMKEGKLPHFSRLKEQGSYRHLATSNPAQSPVAWTGFSTGKNPGKHGIFDFILRDPKTYTLRLSLSETKGTDVRPVLKTKRFWWYTSKKRIPTVILDCPLTFPPEKIYGRMISGMGVPDILGTEGIFSFYTTQPPDNELMAGGKIIPVRKSPVMAMAFIGPRVASAKDKIDYLKVPFKVTLDEQYVPRASARGSIAVLARGHATGKWRPEGSSLDGHSPEATITYQNNTVKLKAGQWSDWQEITFKIDAFRTIRGIMKFYLLETDPDFKLYVSPINFDPRHPFFPISYPKRYSRELAEHIGLYHTQGMPIDTWSVNENLLSEETFLQHVEDVFREKKAMLEYELKRFDKGVLFSYFGITDTIQHIFWRYLDETHPLYERHAPPQFKTAVYDWYKRMDDLLGEAMSHLKEGDILIVLSDHGFDSFRRAAHVNGWLYDHGYLSLKDGSVNRDRMLLGAIDWSKTKAYAIGFGSVYINQKGRESDGIVTPGEETELLKEEISKGLKNWIDEKTHAPVIHNVYKRKEIFWGDHLNEMPDLYIGFNAGYQASWQTATGGVPRGLLEDNLKKWSGSHLFDPALVPGVIFSNQKIIKNNPSIYDLTPTILKAAGFNDEELRRLDFDGEALFR